MFHIEPLGGQVDFSTTPGMVPEVLKPKVEEVFKRFIEKLLPAIQTFPIWDEIREYQLANPEREACPGREVRKDLPYLRVLRGGLMEGK